MKNDTWVKIYKELFIGGLIGVLMSVFLFFGRSIKLPVQMMVDYGMAILIGLAIGFSLYFYGQVLKNLKVFEATDDDDANEQLYRLLNRRYSYLMVAVNIGSVLSIILMTMTIDIELREDRGFMVIPWLAIVLLLFFVALQMKSLKLYHRLRGIEVPLVMTLKELKNNIFQQDEAELQANYKMAFELVLELQNLVLPAIYALLFLISQLTGEVQLSAFLVAGGVHLYIMFKAVKMARHFYK